MLQIAAEVFSGRPNPGCAIPDDGAARSPPRDVTRDRSLPDVAAATEGSFGVRVGVPNGATIRAGLIELRDGPGSRRLADPGRHVERWLIETAAGQLPRGIPEVLRQELERH